MKKWNDAVLLSHPLLVYFISPTHLGDWNILSYLSFLFVNFCLFWLYLNYTLSDIGLFYIKLVYVALYCRHRQKNYVQLLRLCGEYKKWKVFISFFYIFISLLTFLLFILDYFAIRLLFIFLIFCFSLPGRIGRV